MCFNRDNCKFAVESLVMVKLEDTDSSLSSEASHFLDSTEKKNTSENRQCLIATYVCSINVENKLQLRCTEKVCPYLFSPH